jgi:hypothetical protein
MLGVNIGTLLDMGNVPAQRGVVVNLSLLWGENMIFHIFFIE